MGSRFYAKAKFQTALFGKDVSFINTEFNDEVNFNGSIFLDKSYFNNCTFRVTPLFVNTQLPSELHFENVKFDYKNPVDINAKIDFSFTQVDSLRKRTKDPRAKCLLLLHGTDISRLILPYDRFVIKFDTTKLTDNTSEAIYSYEEKCSLYEIILKNCRDAGKSESVRGWDIDYRKMQNIHRFGSTGRYINSFNE